ncbi:MAG: hypothetical protein MUE99_10630 [Chitinophagaceae bacterium]|nr:hypothetical protein [Chitinophagaceae bacterium]
MKPKWYSPGIISLLGILPLFLWKTNYLQDRFDQRVMHVYLPKEGDFDDRIILFSEELVLKNVASKRPSVFYLNDFIDQREIVLEAIRNTGREIKFGYDTSRVVKVIFGENCTFNDLVSVLNICLSDEHKRYAWVQDSIFIFAPDPPRQERYAICPMIPPTVLKIAEEKNWMRDALEYFKSNKLILSGFLILSICGIYQITRDVYSKKNASGKHFSEGTDCNL